MVRCGPLRPAPCPQYAKDVEALIREGLGGVGTDKTTLASTAPPSSETPVWGYRGFMQVQRTGLRGADGSRGLEGWRDRHNAHAVGISTLQESHRPEASKRPEPVRWHHGSAITEVGNVHCWRCGMRTGAQGGQAVARTKAW